MIPGAGHHAPGGFQIKNGRKGGKSVVFALYFGAVKNPVNEEPGFSAKQKPVFLLSVGAN